MFKQGDRVVLVLFADPELRELRLRLKLPLFYIGTFERYRSEQERAEWRAEDDCWVQFDTQGCKCYPSSYLALLTPEREKALARLVF